MRNKQHKLLFGTQRVRLLKQEKCWGLTPALLRRRYVIYLGVYIYLALKSSVREMCSASYAPSKRRSVFTSRQGVTSQRPESSSTLL
jgi:hypothetical protein